MNQPNFQQPLAQCPNLASQLLESVSIEGHLHDLACELWVKQVFVNPSQFPIEAVYTFPLPHGAVLLDLEAKDLVKRRKLCCEPGTGIGFI
jgi:hypothetical protein